MDTNFHDDHNHTFCYLCSISEHEHQRTKPRAESQRRKLIPYKNPKARLSSTSSDLIPYRFIVRTGTQIDGGTRAQVFLYMYGTENNWTSIHLPSTPRDGFPSGSVRTFCLNGPDIGQLHHLNVNLAGARSEKEWYLKEIEATNLKTSTTWLCEFNCWLPKPEEEEINPIKPTTHRQIDFSLTMYALQVRTGEKSFAGTDANVRISVHGSKASTRRLTLTSNRANLFEQHQLDTFVIAGEDLGDLLEIAMESDRDIKQMVMWKMIPSDEHGKVQVYFSFNTWLAKKVSTLKSKRELYPSTDHHFKGPICYHVTVKTGKATNAGTDANVFLIMYGKSGRTMTHQLHNRLKNNFERNSISEFTIMDVDIGKIDRIKIWHDNSGVGSAWFLDYVIIRKKYSISHVVSNVYIQRLEHISKALYRQIDEQIKTVGSSSVNGSRDRLGSSRGILRSPMIYDKASLQKKVTWDEYSIGSQDDLLSMTMQRTSKGKQTNEDPFDHQVFWISKHNYVNDKWKIEWIEENKPFHFEQSTRSAIHHQTKTSVQDHDDEIYECQANRWLAKDSEDGKLEVYLSAIIVQTNIDSKKKHLTPPSVSVLPSNQHSKSPRHIQRSEEELLARITRMPSYQSRAPTTSLKPSPRISLEPTSARSTSKASSHKSIHDQVYHSASGSTFSDDF